MATRTITENVNQAVQDFDNIKQAIIDKGIEVPNGTPTSEYSTKIGDIQGGVTIEGLDTSTVTDFSYFAQKDRFTEEQLQNINTKIGTNFSCMFDSCKALTTIPPLNTSSGTNFGYMFQNCKILTTIPQLDTSNGTIFGYMFNGCSSLTTVPKLNTSNGFSFVYMFQNCTSLTTIPQLDTSSGTSFYSMFNNCSNLTTIPQLDTSNGTNFGYMFYGCSSLTTVPKLNTSKGTDFSSMFRNCTRLTTLELTSFISSQYMFSYCPALENLTVTGTITVNNNYLNLSSSPLLTVESLMSVINALSDNTGKTTYKVTLGATNLAKLTDEQKQIAINKNYTLA